MDRIVKAFRDHPASVGETYFEHMRAALGFTFTMIRAASGCAIHAFLPFLFQKTGSTAVDDLYRRMVTQRATRQLETARAPLQRQATNTGNSRATA